MLGILFNLGFGDEMMEKYENELMGRLYSGVPYGKMLAVTSRGLCEGDFLERVEKIAAKGPRGILQREKDLDAGEYVELARRVLEICRRYGTACILTFKSTYLYAIQSSLSKLTGRENQEAVEAAGRGGGVCLGPLDVPEPVN